MNAASPSGDEGSDSNNTNYAQDTGSAGMLAAIRGLWMPGDVYELRALHSTYPSGYSAGTTSGYFDNVEKFATAVGYLEGRAPGIYWTPNAVSPDLLARANNQVKLKAAATTNDGDIVRRRWIPVDLDPVRPSGIPSTDTEHGAALAKADEITAYLHDQGFPEPVRMDSGNGAYLLVPVDLPNDGDSLVLVKGFLGVLAARFTDKAVKVDTAMFNAARIIRVPGTWNRKGDGTADRPHRLTRLLSMPDQLVLPSAELLGKVAQNGATTSNQKPSESAAEDIAAEIEWMDHWLAKYGLEVKSQGPYTNSSGPGYKWILQTCPFNPNHNIGEAMVGLMPSGARFASCRHDSCTWWRWKDLRAKFEIGGPASDVDADRSPVDVRNDAEAADWLREELGRGELAGVYRREDVLVHTPRMGEAGYLSPEELGLVDAGPAQVRPITTAGVKALVEDRYSIRRRALRAGAREGS